MAFTGAVIINLVAIARDYRAPWVGLLALLPLVLLMLSGLYLFVQPYAVKWTSAQRHTS
jgi:hypothetical protein